MFLDPRKLQETAPADVLEAASRGHLGLDHRFLHSILGRKEEALPAVLAFAERDRSNHAVDIAPELIVISRHWKTPESLPFLIRYIKEDPMELPDEAIELLVEMGQSALDPLLKLYEELDESESGEVAFILANLHIRDERILKLLLDRLEFDLSDTALLLGMYGDPAARPALEIAASEVDDAELKKEITDALETLDEAAAAPSKPSEEENEFDIWSLYPEEADPPMDLLDEDERVELLKHPLAELRAAAAASFFNHDVTLHQRQALLNAATTDEDPVVRARAWESLMNATAEPEVIEAMLAALHKPGLSVEERGGLLVGLAPEADRNEVRETILALYEAPEGRAKALEAMWRSMHPSFRDNFAKHLDDEDVEVRRGAVWGVGYHGLRSELDKLRALFDNEGLRSDALFAYALALPTEVSRGRMKGVLSRIEKDAKGLSEMEEELVKAALDERLMLAGKEPIFSQEED